MADITFTCPWCGESLEAPDELFGKWVPCPACKKDLCIREGDSWPSAAIQAPHPSEHGLTHPAAWVPSPEGHALPTAGTPPTITFAAPLTESPPFQAHSRGTIKCLACGSEAVQLISVTKGDLGAALFGELIAGTAVGVTAGVKNIILNTCMECGAQWVPGTVETLSQIAERKKPFEIGCALIMVLAIILFLAFSCST